MRQYTSLATVLNNGVPASTTQDGMSPSDADLHRLQIPPQQRYKAYVTALATYAATKSDMNVYLFGYRIGSPSRGEA